MKVLDIVQFGGLSFIVSIKTDSSSCVGLPRAEQRPASIQANTGNSTVKQRGRSQGRSKIRLVSANRYAALGQRVPAKTEGDGGKGEQSSYGSEHR